MEEQKRSTLFLPVTKLLIFTKITMQHQKFLNIKLENIINVKHLCFLANKGISRWLIVSKIGVIHPEKNVFIVCSGIIKISFLLKVFFSYVTKYKIYIPN